MSWDIFKIPLRLVKFYHKILNCFYSIYITLLSSLAISIVQDVNFSYTHALLMTIYIALVILYEILVLLLILVITKDLISIILNLLPLLCLFLISAYILWDLKHWIKTTHFWKSFLWKAYQNIFHQWDKCFHLLLLFCSRI